MKEQFNIDKKLTILILLWILDKIIILGMFMFFGSCTIQEEPVVLGHDFELDARLPVDSNGYYHLELGPNWQTTHRITGSVPSIVNDYNTAIIHWSSSHYWYIEDTLGYIVHQQNTLNDYYYYLTPDTTYITWFDGFEVPTINPTSYQTNDGEVNTMIAPVQSMSGDTLTITAYPEFADGYIGKERILKIVVE